MIGVGKISDAALKTGVFDDEPLFYTRGRCTTDLVARP
jgi:hypothetical protein